MYREQVELALLLVLLMVVGFALWVIWLEICVFSEESSRRRLRNLGFLVFDLDLRAGFSGSLALISFLIVDLVFISEGVFLLHISQHTHTHARALFLLLNWGLKRTCRKKKK